MRVRKFIAKLFVIISTFFVVLSPIVLIEEAHHNCTHEDCQICEVIRTAKENIKKTKLLPVGTEAAILIPVLFAVVFSISVSCKYINFSTLFTHY